MSFKLRLHMIERISSIDDVALSLLYICLSILPSRTGAKFGLHCIRFSTVVYDRSLQLQGRTLKCFKYRKKHVFLLFHSTTYNICEKRSLFNLRISKSISRQHTCTITPVHFFIYTLILK